MTHNTREERIDVAIANLVFSGLSIAQMEKIPKWLLENINNNKTEFNQFLHHQLQKAQQDWLREEIVRLEGMKKPTSFTGSENAQIESVFFKHEKGYNQALQTIIDRYHSEIDQDKK